MIKRLDRPHVLDENIQLADRMASARIRLHDKLATLDVKASGVSEYNQRYLGDKIRHAQSVLELYGRLLHLSLHPRDIPLEQFVLVDYGGGSGLLSFLAKELGVGTVIYNDIFEISCADVRRLSNLFGLPLDHIVCGDVEELRAYLRQNRLTINAITSYDVLEHIYDVKRHFRALASLSGNPFRVVYASGANIKNRRYVRAVTKKQLEAEHQNREKKWGHKESDSLQAYFAVRRSMISAYAPDLSSPERETLARRTRGLIQRDIEKCIEEYRRKGSIDYHPDHPTNTCDPSNGNWCEHLMEFRWLEQILQNEGFSARIIPGFHQASTSLLKKNVNRFRNALIWLLGKRAMFLARYYVVCADFPAPQGPVSGRGSAALPGGRQNLR